jgi:protein-tyrosine phosphatase
MSYVDLHLHLLPGVDDGAADEAESLAYVRRMHAEGVREATVTPHIARHVPLDVHSIAGRVARLQRRIDEEGLGVRLHSGGEIHPTSAPTLAPDELERIAQGPPGRRWLLFEVPFAGVDDGFVAQCARLRELGYGLLIAHPERASDLLADGLNRLAPTLAGGGLLQVNVCSLLGHHGLVVQETAVELLRNGLAHVIASDAHPGTREQTLRLGFDLAIRAGASSVQAWRLTQDHPRALLRAGMGVPVLAGPWAHSIRTLAA